MLTAAPLTRTALVGAAVLFAGLAETAPPERFSLVHRLAQGERFAYERVITYRDAGGIQHERSAIVLEVVDAAGSPPLVRQRISVNGGPEKARQIKAAPDGRWSYADSNSVAQDFATWDANQFGDAPETPQPGRRWEVAVPRSAMFAGGRAVVSVVSVRDGRVTIEAAGDSGRRDDTVLDRDTHRYVPVTVRGVWTVRVTYEDGIVQEFRRDDRVHYAVNRNAAQSDDDVDVSIRLVSHTR